MVQKLVITSANFLFAFCLNHRWCAGVKEHLIAWTEHAHLYLNQIYRFR